MHCCYEGESTWKERAKEEGKRDATYLMVAIVIDVVPLRGRVIEHAFEVSNAPARRALPPKRFCLKPPNIVRWFREREHGIDVCRSDVVGLAAGSAVLQHLLRGGEYTADHAAFMR